VALAGLMNKANTATKLADAPRAFRPVLAHEPSAPTAHR
jgi:hypothetical protein